MKTLYWFILNLVFGVWLLISPYVLGFTEMPNAFWNAIVLGVLCSVLSAFGLYHWRGDTSAR